MPFLINLCIIYIISCVLQIIPQMTVMFNTMQYSANNCHVVAEGIMTRKEKLAAYLIETKNFPAYFGCLNPLLHNEKLALFHPLHLLSSDMVVVCYSSNVQREPTGQLYWYCSSCSQLNFHCSGWCIAPQYLCSAHILLSVSELIHYRQVREVMESRIWGQTVYIEMLVHSFIAFYITFT